MFGPYGARPMEYADHPAWCSRECRALSYPVIAQAPAGVSML